MTFHKRSILVTGIPGEKGGFGGHSFLGHGLDPFRVERWSSTTLAAWLSFPDSRIDRGGRDVAAGPGVLDLRMLERRQVRGRSPTPVTRPLGESKATGAPLAKRDLRAEAEKARRLRELG
jgi:hypothetical protein